MSFGGFIDRLLHQDRMCPHCRHVQSTKPTRRRKCEACGQYFRVLANPITKKVSLVTDETAAEYKELREQLAGERAAAKNEEAKKLHTEWLQRYKAELKQQCDVFPFVQIESHGENLCAACSQHDNKIYHFKNVPDLPIKGCTCTGGCRCFATMMLAEDARRAVRA